MTGNEIKAARATLGEKWGVGRSLTPIEMARALGLSPTNGNDHVHNMENEKSKVSGTIAVLVKLYLAGANPPDDLEIFRARGRKRISTETGEMP
ncbi:hypothetical protein [Methylobacterium sp. WCS2018Hpa-22]|uniref:hypothetical protein n=1 Tax=Methylobacterium sp. WCS2018Hpa-22 TaxID=3073633 RepID=UPI002889ABF8|nr:hypothetical protein [Methylobacterium sp. WCS2018Hpa-22]